jgi:glycosyltransferase involved in cell wall biosynthesis
MNILHVVAGLPPAGGGLSELVPMQAREAARAGHDVVVATVAPSDEPLAAAAANAQAAGVRVVRFALSRPHRLVFSAALWRGLRPLVVRADVVHVHSNWTFPVWWACRQARALRRPLVLSPQGCLDPVRRRRGAWKKRLAGLLDRFYLRRATLLHATCEDEARGIRAYVGGRRAPTVAVVPNGVDPDAFAGPADRAALGVRWPACAGRRTTLFLSRIDPIKGLDLLVPAWSRVAGSFADWHLVIAGPDASGYEAVVRKMVEQAGLSSRVTFGGPLYGPEKARILRAADLLILPTHHDNFAIVVAEALASGVPAIVTRNAPWADLLGAAAHGRAGWWVEADVGPLAEAWREAMALSDDERHAMGANGRRLVAAKYTWAASVRNLTAHYARLAVGAGGG